MKFERTKAVALMTVGVLMVMSSAVMWNKTIVELGWSPFATWVFTLAPFVVAWLGFALWHDWRDSKGGE